MAVGRTQKIPSFQTFWSQGCSCHLWWIMSRAECRHSVNFCHFNHHLRMQVSLGCSFWLQRVLLWRIILGKTWSWKSQVASVWRWNDFRQLKGWVWQFEGEKEKKPCQTGKRKSAWKPTCRRWGSNSWRSSQKRNQPSLHHRRWRHTQGHWSPMWRNDPKRIVNLRGGSSQNYRQRRSHHWQIFWFLDCSLIKYQGDQVCLCLKYRCWLWYGFGEADGKKCWIYCDVGFKQQSGCGCLLDSWVLVW